MLISSSIENDDYCSRSQRTEETLRTTLREQDMHAREEHSSETARLRPRTSVLKRSQHQISVSDLSISNVSDILLILSNQISIFFA